MNKIKKQNSPVWYHWISAPTRAAAQKRQMLGFSSHCCHSIINNCCNNINLWFPWTLYVKFCKTVRKSQIKKCMQLQQQLQQLQQHLQQHLPHLLQLLQQLCIFNITQTFYFKFCKMVKKKIISESVYSCCSNCYCSRGYISNCSSNCNSGSASLQLQHQLFIFNISQLCHLSSSGGKATANHQKSMKITNFTQIEHIQLKYNIVRQCNEIMLVSYIKSIHILMRRLSKPNHRVISAYRFPNIDGFGSDEVVKTKTNLCGMPC